MAGGSRAAEGYGFAKPGKSRLEAAPTIFLSLF